MLQRDEREANTIRLLRWILQGWALAAHFWFPAEHPRLYWLFLHYLTSSPPVSASEVSPLVMVNFLCQPDRTMEFPVIWLNITSGCVFEGFWMRLTFESVDGVKQIVLTTVGGPHQISWKLEWKKDQVRKHCLSLFIVFKQVHWCSPAFRLELRLELVPSSLLVLQLADCRSWIFQPL